MANLISTRSSISFAFRFCMLAMSWLDCKIQREIRLNPSFDITLDSLFFFYHDKISSSFDEFHGNITVSWKLPTVTYCRNERYYKVRNLTDQVDKKDEKFTKLINKHKIKKWKERKNCTWWSRRLFCSACVRTRAFFNSLQAKKNLHGSKKHDGAKNFLIEFGKVPRTTMEAASGSGNLARSKSINELWIYYDLFLIKLQQNILPTFVAPLSSFPFLGSALIDKGLLISNANYYLDQRISTSQVWIGQYFFTKNCFQKKNPTKLLSHK